MISESTWDANKSAAEAQKRFEDQVRRKWEQEQAQLSADPTHRAVGQLDQRVQRLETQVASLILQLETKNVK